MSSSPSTRFDGLDICGKREDEFDFGNGQEYPSKFIQAYAESKAKGEKVKIDLPLVCLFSKRRKKKRERRERERETVICRQALRDANDGETFFTVAVAPHQVYGPRDMLFLHNLLLPARDGKLRIFG